MSDATTATSPGRRLLLELVDVPGLFDDLADDADLLTVGINSGELIRLALAIEERTGVPLEDEEMATLYTIDGIDRVLAAAPEVNA
ncbi:MULTISPECIES: phosphopantetheine-binding protein [unclassified Streptomyces]|uniref:phosphopantetheine-binding protein n=1 Tax=unclassified Streptomyces TaxID=2593676 RepID=UPI00136FF9DB|nr:MULTISPECIES: phosphopantetheine-binding protein [unclassified Streptomyces]MCW5253063.1 acyl carrier protein [Streptomyces sp. SHP 1-2]MYU20824.1 acyl carrier protein [Streptomyces sp. SID8352]